MNSNAVNNWGEQTSANFLAADRTCDNDSLMESISKKIDQFPRWHINDLSQFVIPDKGITVVLEGWTIEAAMKCCLPFLPPHPRTQSGSHQFHLVLIDFRKRILLLVASCELAPRIQQESWPSDLPSPPSSDQEIALSASKVGHLQQHPDQGEHQALWSKHLPEPRSHLCVDTPLARPGSDQ